MARRIHSIAGSVALLTILTFWISTVVVELFGDEAAIVLVKTSIPWGFLVLVPALAATGISGTRMARLRGGPLVRAKSRRMAFIAANGILILVPSAIYLALEAQAGEFDEGFVVMQAVELIAGAANIALLSLNMRDGLRLTGTLRRPSGRVPKRRLSMHDGLLAGLALIALGSGVAATLAADAASQRIVLSLHAPLGLLVLALVLVQIGRRMLARRDDGRNETTKKNDARPMLLPIVTGGFYVVLAGMAASGIGMMVLSGAHEVLLSLDDAPLPNFWAFAPRIPHAIGARLLVTVMILLAAVGLYRAFIRPGAGTRGRPRESF